jgi:hypothetical protein
MMYFSSLRLRTLTRAADSSVPREARIMTAMTIECATPRLAAGAKPARRAGVQSFAQRHTLGKAEIEERRMIKPVNVW